MIFNTKSHFYSEHLLNFQADGWLQILWLVPKGLGIQGHLSRVYAQLPQPLGQLWWGHMLLLGGKSMHIFFRFPRALEPETLLGGMWFPECLLGSPSSLQTLFWFWSLAHRPTASQLVGLALSKLNSAGKWSILYYNNACLFFTNQNKI